MLIYFLIFLGLCFLLWNFPFIRIVVFNIFRVIIYFFIDTFNFFRRLQFHNPKNIGLRCYEGLFGHGKTLSMVHDTVKLYKKYNDRLVWVKGRGFVRQYVQVLSNIDIKSIPYIEMVSLKQITDIAERQAKYDEEHGVITKTIICADEFSVQLNSRSYASNIDSLLLETILEQRHFGIFAFMYTSQRFGQVDALCRQVTSDVVNCHLYFKRILVHNIYDAWDYENATNKSLIKPIKKGGFFVRNKDFNAYDTLATVHTLIKKCLNGDFVPPSDILARQGIVLTDDGKVQNFKRTLFGRRKA